MAKGIRRRDATTNALRKPMFQIVTTFNEDEMKILQNAYVKELSEETREYVSLPRWMKRHLLESLEETK